MYYPYLRAKQYELKAIKEFAERNKEQNAIMPILEPVKKQTSALSLAIHDLLDYGMKFALVLNPKDGDFKHSTISFDILNSDAGLREKQGLWIPAFIYTKNSIKEILEMKDEFHLKHVMLIFKKCIDLDDEQAWNLLEQPEIEYVVNAFGTTVSRRVKSQLKSKCKNVIRLDSCFISKVRNADYLVDDDELFSEEPFFYNTEENFDGYSDFTVLPELYIEGGMLPYAIAIHITYQKNAEQLYVHHFVSDSNETNNDIRGKFHEAAAKIEPFFRDKNRNTAIDELISRSNDGNGYPGLGYIKKLSILNHLELILSL